MIVVAGGGEQGTSTVHKATRLRSFCLTPFRFPWAHNSGHAVSVIRSGFRDATDRRSFEARMIFRHFTLHPGGLNVDFDFMESQRALQTLRFLFVFERYIARAILGCFQTTDEEGVPSKCLVHFLKF